MLLSKNRPVRSLIAIMIVVVAVAVIVAAVYYGRKNSSVDPRVVHARELYSKYDDYAYRGEFSKLFPLLDSIENEYKTFDHYSNSYEIGVLYNNRAAALLTIAFYVDSIDSLDNPFMDLPSDSLVDMAEAHLLKAIGLYTDWLTDYGDKQEGEIRELIRKEFLKGLERSDPDQFETYLKARAGEMVDAAAENQRRLSVACTNLGVVQRHRQQYEEAVRLYEEALSLWDRNLEAENNINRLLGKPIKKRNFIQRLFPPGKEE